MRITKVFGELCELKTTLFLTTSIIADDSASTLDHLYDAYIQRHIADHNKRYLARKAQRRAQAMDGKKKKRYNTRLAAKEAEEAEQARARIRLPTAGIRPQPSTDDSTTQQTVNNGGGQPPPTDLLAHLKANGSVPTGPAEPAATVAASLPSLSDVIRATAEISRRPTRGDSTNTAQSHATTEPGTQQFIQDDDQEMEDAVSRDFDNVEENRGKDPRTHNTSRRGRRPTAEAGAEDGRGNQEEDDEDDDVVMNEEAKKNHAVVAGAARYENINYPDVDRTMKMPKVNTNTHWASWNPAMRTPEWYAKKPGFIIQATMRKQEYDAAPPKWANVQLQHMVGDGDAVENQMAQYIKAADIRVTYYTDETKTWAPWQFIYEMAIADGYTQDQAELWASGTPCPHWKQYPECGVTLATSCAAKNAQHFDDAAVPEETVKARRRRLEQEGLNQHQFILRQEQELAQLRRDREKAQKRRTTFEVAMAANPERMVRALYRELLDRYEERGPEGDAEGLDGGEEKKQDRSRNNERRNHHRRSHSRSRSRSRRRSRSTSRTRNTARPYYSRRTGHTGDRSPPPSRRDSNDYGTHSQRRGGPKNGFENHNRRDNNVYGPAPTTTVSALRAYGGYADDNGRESTARRHGSYGDRSRDSGGDDRRGGGDQPNGRGGGDQPNGRGGGDQPNGRGGGDQPNGRGGGDQPNGRGGGDRRDGRASGLSVRFKASSRSQGQNPTMDDDESAIPSMPPPLPFEASANRRRWHTRRIDPASLAVDAQARFAHYSRAQAYTALLGLRDTGIVKQAREVNGWRIPAEFQQYRYRYMGDQDAARALAYLRVMGYAAHPRNRVDMKLAYAQYANGDANSKTAEALPGRRNCDIWMMSEVLETAKGYYRLVEVRRAFRFLYDALKNAGWCRDTIDDLLLPIWECYERRDNDVAGLVELAAVLQLRSTVGNHSARNGRNDGHDAFAMAALAAMKQTIEDGTFDVSLATMLRDDNDYREVVGGRSISTSCQAYAAWLKRSGRQSGTKTSTSTSTSTRKSRSADKYSETNLPHVDCQFDGHCFNRNLSESDPKRCIRRHSGPPNPAAIPKKVQNKGKGGKLNEEN